MINRIATFNIFYWIYIFLQFYHFLKGLPNCHEQVSRTKTYTIIKLHIFFSAFF